MLRFFYRRCSIPQITLKNDIYAILDNVVDPKDEAYKKTVTMARQEANYLLTDLVLRRDEVMKIDRASSVNAQVKAM